MLDNIDWGRTITVLVFVVSIGSSSFTLFLMILRTSRTSRKLKEKYKISDDFFVANSVTITLDRLNYQGCIMHDRSNFYHQLNYLSRIGSIWFLALAIFVQPVYNLAFVYMISFVITVLITVLSLVLDFSEKSYYYRESFTDYLEAISLFEGSKGLKNQQKKTTEILKVIARAEERVEH